MFENLYVDPLDSKSQNKYIKLNQLLLKYVELQKLDQLCKGDELNIKQKKNLRRKPKIKKLAMKLIHERLTKKLKPEETYEVWHSQRNLNKNLERQGKAKTVKEVLEEAGTGTGTETETETGGEISDSDNLDSNSDSGSSMVSEEVENDLKKFISTFDGSNSWCKANVIIQTRGLEILPQTNNDSDGNFGDGGLQKGTVGFNRYHVTNLRNLLHLNMLRRNWDLAYKVFCLLVRLKNVDIRSIWPIGIEILIQQQQRQSYRNSAQLFKDEKFFEWLKSFFIITRSTIRNSRLVSAPIWRSGSKTHTPLYIITSLWRLMIKNETSKVEDTLDELLLEPPFNTEGVFYFLLAMCKLSNCYKEIVSKDEILSNISSIEKNLELCKKYHFIYPKELMTRELKLVFNMVNPSEEKEFLEQSSSSEDEDEGNNDSDKRGKTTDTSFAYETADEYYGDVQGYTDVVEAQPTYNELDGQENGNQNQEITMDFDFDFE